MAMESREAVEGRAQRRLGPGLLRAALALGALLALAWFAAQAQALTVSGDIMQPTTWRLADSPVMVTGDVRVLNSTTLTVQAGVEVRFKADAGLFVGQFNRFADSRDRGALVVQGTSTAPVTFVSDAGLKDWDGIVFDGRRDPDLASSVTFATVEGSKADGIKLNAISPPVTDTTSRGHAGSGLVLESASPSVTRGSFSSNGAYGIDADVNSVPTISSAAIDSNNKPLRLKMTSPLSGLTFSGNAVPRIEVLAGDVFANARLSRWVDTVAGVLEYKALGSALVANSAALTIDAGVTLRFPPNAALQVGQLNRFSDSRDRGALVVQGTAALPVSFVSDSGAKDWDGLVFDGRRDPDLTSSLAFLVVESTATAGIKLIGISPALTDTTSRNHVGSGLVLESASPTVTRGSFSSNGAYGVDGDGGSAPAVKDAAIDANNRPLRLQFSSALSGLTFNNNTIAEVELRGGDVFRDTRLPRFADAVAGVLVYRALGSTIVANGATLTLDAGVTLRFPAATGLQIGQLDRFRDSRDRGGIVTQGTSALPILLTVDGAGEWAGLVLDGRRDPDLLSSISFTTFEKATRGAWLTLFNPTIADSVFRLSGQGLVLENASPAILRSAFEDNRGYGILVSAGSQPSIDASSFARNGERPMRVMIGTKLTGLSFTDNGIDEIEMWGDGNLRFSSTLPRFTTSTGTPLPYILLSNTLVRGSGTLTVDPGVTLRFRAGVEMRFGAQDRAWGWGDDRCEGFESGALQALGNATHPILFTADNGAQSWSGLYFDGRCIGGSVVPSRLEHTVLELTNTYGIRARGHVPGKLTILSSTLRDNAGHGLQVEGGYVLAQASTFLRNGDHGVWSDSGGSPDVRDALIQDNQWPLRVRANPWPSGLTISGHRFNVIEFWGGDITGSFTMARLTDAVTAMPLLYRLIGTLNLDNQATLTIEPGVTLQVDNGGINIGWRTQAGLHAIGTSEMPITFTSWSGTQSWDGIRVGSGATRLPVKIAFATIELSRGAAVYAASHDNVVLEDVTLKNIAGTWAVYDTDSRSSVTLTRVTFLDVQRPFYLHARSVHSELRILSTAVPEVHIHGGDLTVSRTLGVRDVAGRSLTHHLTGTLTVHGGATLTLMPGLELRPGVLRLGIDNRGNCWEPQWPGSLVAVGTEAEPIRIIGGGNDREVLAFLGYCPTGPSSARLANVTITGTSAGWGDSGGAVRVGGYGGATFTDVTIADNGRYGIWCRDAGLLLERVTLRNNYWSGLRGGACSPTILNSRIEGNGWGGDADHRNDGVYLSEGGGGTIRGNLFVNNNDAGLQVESNVYPTVTGNTFTDNRIPGRFHLRSDLFTNTFGASRSRPPEIQLWGTTLGADMTIPSVSFDGQRYIYFMLNGLTVTSKATLTVEPGVTLAFHAGTQFRVGQCMISGWWQNRECYMYETGGDGQQGGLRAEGTPEAPIRFTSYGGLGGWNPGDWAGLVLDGRSQPPLPSSLKHVTIDRSYSDGLLVKRHGALTLSDITVQDNADDGLELQLTSIRIPNLVARRNGQAGVMDWAGSSVLANAVLEGNGNFPFRAQPGTQYVGSSALRFEGGRASGSAWAGLASPTADFSQLAISKVGSPTVLVIHGNVNGAGVFRALTTSEGQPIVYRVLASGQGSTLNVPPGSTLTIEPGVTVLFDGNTGLSAATCNSWWREDVCNSYVYPGGSILAEGTQDQPIRLAPTSGNRDWRGIQAYGGGGSLRLRDATIESPAEHGLLVSSQGNAVVERVTITNTGGAGMYLIGSSGTYRGVTIRGTGTYGVLLESGSTPRLENFVVERAGYYGLAMDSGSVPTVAGMRIEGSGWRPIRATVPAVLQGIVLGPHANPWAELVGGEYGGSATIERLLGPDGNTQPWVVLGFIRFVNQAVLTVDAGAEMRFMPGAGIQIGRDNCPEITGWWGGFQGCRTDPSWGGALVVQGTPELPVVMGSHRSQQDWFGVRLSLTWAAAPQPGSVIRHLTVSQASDKGLDVRSVAGLVTEGLSLSDNRGDGLAMAASSGTFTGLRSEGNGGDGLIVSDAPYCDRGYCGIQNSGSLVLTGGALRDNRGWGAELLAGSARGISLDGLAMLGNRAGAINVVGPFAAQVSGAQLPLGGTLLRVVSSGATQRFSTSTVDGQPFAGAFTPSVVGTQPLSLGVEDGSQRRRVLAENGPDGSRWSHEVGGLFVKANYTYRSIASDDRVTQGPTLVKTNLQGAAALDTLLNGPRRVVLDVLPEVFMDFTWDPRGAKSPTDLDDVRFTDTSLVRYADKVAWFWDFGDGNLSSEQGPVYNYLDDSEGSPYRVRLRLTLNDSENSVPSLTKLVEVFNVAATPDWKSGPPRPTILDKVNFTDLSFDPDGRIISWQWDFGDSTASTAQNPEKQYSAWGTYNVTLRVRDDDLALSRLVRPLKVWSFDELLVATAQDAMAMAERRLLTGQQDAQGLVRDLRAAVDENATQMQERAKLLAQTAQDDAKKAITEAQARANATLDSAKALAEEARLNQATADCLVAAIKAQLGMPASKPVVDCATPVAEGAIAIAEREAGKVLGGVGF